MRRIHVDENVTIRTDEAANEAFLSENDLQFFDENNGIAKVTKQRWEKAQRTERKHWMELGKSSKDDRNFYHLEKFANYSSIKDKTINNALEVGCGPFTNLRLIGDYCKIKKCSLNDPLIESYLQHKNCTYKNDELVIDTSTSKKAFFNRFVKKKILINELYTCAFEDINSEEQFDLIVIINVIEHCYDLDKFLKKVLSLLSSDGILIFEDKLYELEKLKSDVNIVYDAAHPLRVNKELIIEFLNKNFIQTYGKIEPNKTELEGNLFEWDDIYYIGNKK